MTGPSILLGTSSWTASGWKSAFYPKGTKPEEFLRHYARHFPTTEIDSTFYAIPPPGTVSAWIERSPSDFLFAAKAPQIITHQKILVDAAEDLLDFCRAMEPMGSRLGPLLLQFPYFSREKLSEADFLSRLDTFLPLLPSEFRWALEIRNRGWIGEPLLDRLRSQGVAFTLIDHPWMPRPQDYTDPAAVVTTDFSYVRWLGDRHKIEEMTTTWDHTILDRTTELKAWASLLQQIQPQVRKVYAYANNHYAGYSPETLRTFNELWGGGLLPDPHLETESLSPDSPAQLSLFDKL